MTQCALCLHCISQSSPATRKIGECWATDEHKAVEVLKIRTCKDWELGHIHIVQGRGFRIENSIAKLR